MDLEFVLLFHLLEDVGISLLVDYIIKGAISITTSTLDKRLIG